MKGTWFIVAILSALVVAAAESLEMRAEIYAGAAGGLVLGLVGLAFGLGILARHDRESETHAKNWDIWGLWGGGLLVRLALLGPASWLLWRLEGTYVPAALLSLAMVYLTLLFCETHWLSSRLCDLPGARLETNNG